MSWVLLCFASSKVEFLLAMGVASGGIISTAKRAK